MEKQAIKQKDHNKYLDVQLLKIIYIGKNNNFKNLDNSIKDILLYINRRYEIDGIIGIGVVHVRDLF